MRTFLSNDIVFINQDSGYLMIDIVNAYVNAGFSCSLITGRLVVRNKPLNKSIKVKRIIEYNRSTSFNRIFTWSWAAIQIIWIIRTRFPKSHLFIVSNPPLAPLIPMILRNPFSILIFDIYPDALTELGYFSQKSWIIKLWSKVNRKSFSRANTIYTISEGMKNVLKKYLDVNEPVVVPLWTDNLFLKPVDPRVNPFIKKHDLSGKFIVLYSGNLGLSGDVDSLIEVAAMTQRDDILFLIIGEGARKEIIRSEVFSRNLSNVKLMPWQPAEVLPFSLSSASLAVVTQGRQFSKLVVPSKVFNYLSVGAPLLCITSPGSEIDFLVKKYECGNSFEPDDIRGMVGYINMLADNRNLQRRIKLCSLKASQDFQKSNVKGFLPQ